MRYVQMLPVVTATIALSPHFVFAQGAADYPNKPVRIIVGSTVGGGSDVQARIFAQRMSENLKNQFLVDNRIGAGDTIAAGVVAKSVPDGYTLLAASGSFTMFPALYPNFPHDPLKDFAPISLLAKTPFLLLVHPALPAKSIKELIALAKARPGELDVGAAFGSTSHLSAAYFASASKIKLSFISYKGGGQIVVDVISGQIHMFMGNVLAMMPHLKSGRLRALAITSGNRSSVLPEMPTIAESGVPGYDVSTWSGWVAPAGTPTAIINKLNAELVNIVKSPEFTKRLAEDGGEPVGSTPEQLRQHMALEIPRWNKVVKDVGIGVEYKQ